MQSNTSLGNMQQLAAQTQRPSFAANIPGIKGGAMAIAGGGIGTRKLTGLLISVENLHEPVYNWVMNAVALTQIISIRETNMGIHRTLESYYNKSFHVYIAPTSLLLG